MRGLERLIGFAIRRDPGLTSDIRKLLSPDLPEQHEGTSIDSDTMLDSWKTSAVAKDVDLLLPALERGETKQWHKLFAARPGPDYRSDGFFVADSNAPSDSVPDPMQTYPLTSRSRLGVQSLECLFTQPGDFHAARPHLIPSNEGFDDNEAAAVAGELDDVMSASIKASPAPSIPGNAKQMIDEYLAYTNCWLPILEPHELLRTFHQYRSSDSLGHRQRKTEDLGQLAVLRAVFAYESCKSGTETGRVETDELHKHPTYKAARSLILPEDDEHGSGHIQALLILSLINLGHGYWKSCWLLIGSAQRLLQYIGVDKAQMEGSTPFQNPQSHSTRTAHIMLGCSVLEKMLTMRVRPSLWLSSGVLSQYRAEISLDEDGMEEWETPRFPNRPPDALYQHEGVIPAKILSTFNGLAKTAQGLSELLSLTDHDSELSLYGPEHEKFSQTLHAQNYELHQNYIHSHYPQALLHYLMNQCAILALSRLRLKMKAVPTATEHSSANVLSQLTSLTTISSVFEQFTQRHGPSRVPVVLVIVLYRMFEDITFLVEFSQLKGQSTIIPYFQALHKSIEGIGRSWPAFDQVRETLLPWMQNGSLPEQQRSSVAVPVFPSNESSHRGNSLEYELSENLMDLQPPAGTSVVAPVTSRSVFCRSRTGSEMQSFELTNPGLETNTASNDLLRVSRQTQGLDAFSDGLEGVDDVYFQLAQADITEWSANWQRDGLWELGFDTDAFEQLYNRGQ